MKSTSNSEEAQRLAAIFATAIDGIITIDQNGIIESYNRAARKLFQYTTEEVIGQNVKMLMPAPHRQRHDEYLSNYVKTRRPKIIGVGREVDGQRKDGTTFPMRLAVSEVKLNNRIIFTGIVHDLTEVKNAQSEILRLNTKLEQKVTRRTEELSKAIEQLQHTNQILETEIDEREKVEEALRRSEEDIRKALDKEKELGELKSRFVSMASHEFRTPLSTILSSASLLGRYPKEDQQPQREKHINRIKSAVTTLTNVLNDFLSLSKLEEGKVGYHPVELDLNEFCRTVLDEMQGLLKPGQEFVYEKEWNDATVILDEHLLKNIIYNLVSNAIKYSPEGKKIYLYCKIETDFLQIAVRDEGIGIPQADQEYMFERFFRATNSANIQGTGLGLSIVRSYLEMMGGTINFDSEENVGSTFRIMIPLKART